MESHLASLVRRSAGWLPFIALPAGCLTFNLYVIIVTAVITIVCIPCLTMILHLNLTGSLHEWEKNVWRTELVGRGLCVWSYRTYRELYSAEVTAWTYVRATDLRAATEDLPSYSRLKGARE